MYHFNKGQYICGEVTKQRKGGLNSRSNNRGKVNIWRKLMEDKGYSSKTCLCRPISVLNFFSPVIWEREGGIFMTCF